MGTVRDPLGPFPWYRAMRATAPVAYDERSDTWHVFRYEDVQRVLSKHAVFSSEFGRQPGQEPHPAIQASLVSTDPPRHRQLRMIVSRAFTPRAVDALAPRITQIVDDLLDKVVEAGEMDLIWDFAHPLPVIVIAELLGIPVEERDQFKRWSNAVITGPTGASASSSGPAEAHRELAQHFSRLIEERRRQPKDDLLSDLLAARIEGQHLEWNALVGFCVFLLLAGTETTTNVIGNAMLCLDEAPETLAELRRDPSLLPDAIEEVLRYRSPVQSVFRTVTRDTTIGDKELRAGQRVFAWVGSANRDELAFEDAERFDIRRAPNRHLAFGQGIHFCLGAPLARLETRIALTALLERLPDLRRASGAPLVRIASAMVYGVTSLPVTFSIP